MTFLCQRVTLSLSKGIVAYMRKIGTDSSATAHTILPAGTFINYCFDSFSSRSMPTVLLTGANGGLGTAFAHCFAKANWQVALVGRKHDELVALASSLAGAHPSAPAAVVLEFDIGQSGQIEALIREMTTRDISIDALVNNAGFGLYGTFADLPLETQLNMTDVNIRALTELTHRVLPQMRERKHGYVLNIASTAAFQAGPLMTVYYATKAYVLSFSEGLRREQRGTGVSVTCLCPGPTRTHFADTAKLNKSRLFSANVMNADDVAELGVAAMLQRRGTVIAGRKNALLAFLTRLVPRSVAAAAAEFAQKQT